MKKQSLGCLSKGMQEKGTKHLLRDESGLTTAGIVIALLITLSLVFSAAQVYQINSASATIQNVADLATLAAENEVAEFYIVARLCDAIVLSLSLAAVITISLGIVALCVPATIPLAEKLIKTGVDILKARNNFAEKAIEGLNVLQKALPFISAANAESVILANSGGPMKASYLGIAILLPFEGREISLGSSDAANALIQDVEKNQDELKKASEEAEKAAHEARKLKEQAFLHDCGNNPEYCMYERASHLAVLSEQENPLYHSVDTWDFSVALKRAQSYYRQRLALEIPTDLSVEALADSQLRKRFYAYASQKLEQGYVIEDEQGLFQAHFPLLPKNTDEMRESSLYTEVVYPISKKASGTSMMHAWEACPEMLVREFVGVGSLSDLDGGGYELCPQCKFSVSSFGKIAAASSSVESGFEYHYRIVAQAAEAYKKAQEVYAPHAQKVKELSGSLFESAKEALSEALSYRIDVLPPGNLGAIALVANVQSVSSSQNFFSSFVANGTTLGAQAALSASTLVADSSDEHATIVSSMLDGLSQNSENLGLVAGDAVLDLWSSLLMAYTQGQKALITGLKQSLDKIPLSSESGLGSWAAGALSDLLESIGLEPADLRSLKPVLLNSAHILAADESNFSSTLLGIKQSYLSLEGDVSGSLWGGAVSQLESYALESIEGFGDDLVIASIELIEGVGPNIPVTIALPPAVKTVAQNFIQEIAQTLRGLEPEAVGVRRWE